MSSDLGELSLQEAKEALAQLIADSFHEELAAQIMERIEKGDSAVFLID